MATEKLFNRRPRRTIPILLSSLSVSACSLPPLATWHAPPRAGAPHVEIGTASWYGPGFHGGTTSSGETYDQNAMTAAHQTLPLGSRVMVTNLENGRSVELRINDRGPFIDGRIIDLSYAAANELGLVGPGTGSVRVERLDDGSAAGSFVMYAVQAGAFADQTRALALQERLAGHIRDVYVVPHAASIRVVYRVRVGPFARREEAFTEARQLDRLGVGAMVVEEVVQ